MMPARRIGSESRLADPVVDVVGELRALTVNEMEEDFPVPLGPGQARVYDPGSLGLPTQSRSRHVTDDAPPHVRRTNDAALHLRAARLELRLHEDDCFPARGG